MQCIAYMLRSIAVRVLVLVLYAAKALVAIPSLIDWEIDRLLSRIRRIR